MAKSKRMDWLAGHYVLSVRGSTQQVVASVSGNARQRRRVVRIWKKMGYGVAPFLRAWTV